MPEDAPNFAAWLDDFFAAYYRNRPVNGTFIGVHAYDDRLPDYSESGAGDTLAEMETLLGRLRLLPAEPLSPAQDIDRRLAEGFLEIQGWEFRSTHFQGGNPCTYTGEAIFGLISLFLTPFAPLAQRLDVAAARMAAVPGLLQQGRMNLRSAPPAWTARAIHECEGALAFLGEGLDRLVEAEDITDVSWRSAASAAAAAFRDFRAFLETELLAHPDAATACGPEALDRLLKQGHFIDLTADEIAALAEQELQAAQAYLNEHAPDFGAASPEAALAALQDLHPTVGAYPRRYGELWTASRAACQAHDLLTWPDFPIRYVPQPAWARTAAPYLYFLFYRAPAAFDRPPIHDYLITPIEASLPPAEQQALLRANNDSVIKTNHVVHHGGLGHHVQNWHAYRASSRIGQVAAVDCASRIAMFCGATMAEGWAVYATNLMHEADFLTPLENYSEFQSRRRFCARALVDVRLHQGRFSLDEAAQFYQQRAGMSPAAARGEAVKNSMFPGAAVIYLLGSDRIQRLRRELAVRQGSRFNLRAFHDQFLSYGSIPVELIAQAMEKETIRD
jgi:Bacterial protein of unknown function (DUF885)